MEDFIDFVGGPPPLGDFFFSFLFYILEMKVRKEERDV